MRIPEDVSIIGYGDIPLASWLNPPLTTVHVDFFNMGKTAMSLLFDIIDNPHRKSEPKFVETSLMIRESVSKPPLEKTQP